MPVLCTHCWHSGCACRRWWWWCTLYSAPKIAKQWQRCCVCVRQRRQCTAVCHWKKRRWQPQLSRSKRGSTAFCGTITVFSGCVNCAADLRLPFHSTGISQHLPLSLIGKMLCLLPKWHWCCWGISYSCDSLLLSSLSRPLYFGEFSAVPYMQRCEFLHGDFSDCCCCCRGVWDMLCWWCSCRMSAGLRTLQLLAIGDSSVAMIITVAIRTGIRVLIELIVICIDGRWDGANDNGRDHGRASAKWSADCKDSGSHFF